jgi:methylthioribose-1-phosphate isomerase
LTSAGDPTLRWDDGAIVLVDQRSLPREVRTLRVETVDGLIEAIQALAVRGAPAIGLAGAFGVALSAHCHRDGDGVDMAAVARDAKLLAEARPTAVHLARAVGRAMGRLGDGPEAVLAEAQAMVAEDAAVNRAAADRATALLAQLCPDRPLRLLTHCNTGRLATAAVGTALGAILELAARGRVLEVLVDETRPLLQGARLTAWELAEAGVPYRLCVDSAAAAAMAGGLVDCVLVGADRIARNGDTANKIGTYGLAVAAARHGIPFVVVAPESSWDEQLGDGSGIVIEERNGAEVTAFAGVQAAPLGAAVYNPGFDVTPGELITAIVTECREFRPRTPGPAEELAEFSRELYSRGWMPGTSGNLSVRAPDGPPGTVLITASGRDKGALTARDTVAVHAATGDPLPARAGRYQGPGDVLRASAETSIHAAIYRTTTARAVIHVHSPYATAVACRAGRTDRLTTLRLERFELLKGLGLAAAAAAALPVFPNWADVPRIAAEVAAHLGAQADARPGALPGLLIADHGITVWGDDLAQARNRLECLEAICQLLTLSRPESWAISEGLTP